MSTVYTFPSWPFGELVCKLGEFTVSLSLGVSVFTLTALSAERYMVIVHPMTAVHRSAASGVSSSLLHAVLVAAGIWVLSAALASVELVASPVLVPGLAAGLDPPQGRGGAGGGARQRRSSRRVPRVPRRVGRELREFPRHLPLPRLLRTDPDLFLDLDLAPTATPSWSTSRCRS